MLFTKGARRSNKLEELHGDVIVCNWNGIVFPLSSCMECKQDNECDHIMCQGTYTDELMAGGFDVVTLSCFHLTIASGKLQQKDHSHVLVGIL